MRICFETLLSVNTILVNKDAMMIVCAQWFLKHHLVTVCWEAWLTFMSNFQVQKIFFNVYEIPEGKDKPSVREVTMQRKVQMSSSDGPILSSENWSLQEPTVEDRNAIKLNIGGKLLYNYCYFSCYYSY